MQGGGGLPFNPQDIMKKLNIANLMPVDSGSSSNSIFDMAGDKTFVRKVKKSDYGKISKELDGTDNLFTDNDFPPNSSSLGDLQPHGINPSRVKWKRVRDFIRNPVLIKDKVEPGDILQGQLGDCYFLSALSSLA